MKSFHELTPAEQGRIQRAIAAVWSPATTATELPAPSEAADFSIGHILGTYRHPQPDALTPEQAEATARKLVAALRKQGVQLHEPRWLGGAEYYRWLRAEFLFLPVAATVSAEHPVDFHFTELVPDGVDNMTRTLEGFVGELFELGDLPHVKWLAGGATAPLFTARRRYLEAWLASFMALRLERLRPVAVHDLAPGRVLLDFDMAYAVTFEDRTRGAMTGSGRAELVLDRGTWRIVELSFPGCSLPA